MNRRLGNWLVAALFLGAAWGATQILPTDTAHRAPFVTAGSLGERIETRNFVVTVHDVMLVDTLTDSTWGDAWKGEANWLVVDLSAQLTKTENLGWLNTKNLIIGDDRYSPSERVEATIANESLAIAFSVRGYLVYELPPGLTSGDVTLQFGNDSYLVAGAIVSITFDLDSLDRESSLEITRPVVEERQ